MQKPKSYDAKYSKQNQSFILLKPPRKKGTGYGGDLLNEYERCKTVAFAVAGA